jgi:hypothetical protein
VTLISLKSKLTTLPFGNATKIKDFRTLLEIYKNAKAQKRAFAFFCGSSAKGACPKVI